MEQIVLKADINVCEISGWQSNTGEVKVRDLQVDLCEELSNCGNAFVIFKLADGTVYESKVKDGKADIPVIDKPQFIEIGVYTEDTVNGECVKRYSPHPVAAYINNGSYSGAGTEPPIPTAGTYAELLELIKEGGSDINIQEEIDVGGEYGENDVPSVNAFLGVVGLIGEEFASKSELNKVQGILEGNYQSLNQRLKEHMAFQHVINVETADSLDAIEQRLDNLDGEYTQALELLGGAE